MKRTWRGVRHWCRQLLGHILGGCVPLFLHHEASEGTRILVVRLDDRVGNVLLTTPLLQALSACPKYQVDVVVAESKQVLVAGLARVIPLRRRDFFVRPWAFWTQLWALRGAHYGVVIDASH